MERAVRAIARYRWPYRRGYLPGKMLNQYDRLPLANQSAIIANLIKYY